MNEIIEIKYQDFKKKDLDSPLRKLSKQVLKIDNSTLEIIDNLKRVFDSYKISVGLAAPQIGYNLRIIMINLDKQKKEDIVMINPQVLSNTGKTKESYESCLSLPNYKGKVKRKNKLVVEYTTLDGNKKEIEASGFLARVILHEIDHLNGVLFVDRMENFEKLEKVDFDWE